jgi:hypothetical protein
VSPEGGAAGTGAAGRRHAKLDYVRAALAIVVVAAALPVVIWADSSQMLQLCRDGAASVGVNPVVRVCAPPSSDPLVAGIAGLLLLMVVLALVRPFVSEIGFLGATAKLREEVAQNRKRVNQLTLSQAPEVAKVESKVTAFRARVSEVQQESIAQLFTAGFRIVAAERARLEQQLRALWPRLRAEMGEAPLPAGGWAGITLWRNQFYLEYQVVRAAVELLEQNPDSVPDDELRRAVEIAEKITDAWPH